MIPAIALPTDRPLLTDGGMGEAIALRGLHRKGSSFWSGRALIEAPEMVDELHRAFIDAGADLITTNTYGVVRSFMRDLGIEDQFEALNLKAAEIANRARDASARDVLVAGSLPPLSESYLPDEIEAEERLFELYTEQAALLAPHVDLLVVETLTTIEETRAAAKGAAATGKPFWIGWSLHEGKDGRLKGGAAVTEAAASVDGLPVSAFLANCCSPEAVTRSLPVLKSLGTPTGGYANTFHPIDPRQKNISRRHDLSVEEYAANVSDWIDAGAQIVGGCCGTLPEHIARVRALIDAHH
ncbi:MAG: homocysteine S-methyltransferase [Rhodospirillaceae bacterium]|nr:homocysteine S-methyltransferase [Rhodospirillaceae bacterium]|tara:strand:+ start:5835 stop:6728 length:894 start_codon:yes stop_codon:yes gene_type:complete